MGRWGRSFVARAPTAQEIAAFSGPGALDPVRVYVGRRSADRIEIRSGLKAGDKVVNAGQNRLSSGAAVKITDEPAPAAN